MSTRLNPLSAEPGIASHSAAQTTVIAASVTRAPDQGWNEYPKEALTCSTDLSDTSSKGETYAECSGLIAKVALLRCNLSKLICPPAAQQKKVRSDID